MWRKPNRKGRYKPKSSNARSKSEGSKDTKQTPGQFIMTEPLARHSEDLNLLTGLAGTIISLSATPEQKAKFHEIYSDYTKRISSEESSALIPLDYVWENSEQIAPYSEIFFEMLLCRMVDNFLTYISDLLYLIFETNPDVLTKNRDGVSIQMVFQRPSIVELRSEIIERRIMDLSYRGMKTLQIHLAEPARLGFKLFPSTNTLKAAVDIIELRNLIVHNRGVINRTFLSRISNPSKYKLDTKLTLSGQFLSSIINFFITESIDIDDRASKKFKLPQSVAMTAEESAQNGIVKFLLSISRDEATK